MGGHLQRIRKAAWWGTLPSLTCFIGALWAQPASFIPEGATVVLMAGLPGDVESETDYDQQLRTWLEITESAGRARNLFAFCDNAQAVAPPARVQGKVHKATRENFIGLRQTLAGSTNALVVIAWGHGGKQGDTPVFHVRGPRLTPADFKSLGDAVATAESRWILIFRGSGSFAAQLAGTGRQILSSEHDTIFNNDPVAMPLLLKLARVNSTPSFVALGEELGRAITRWYNERHLARTEEPTLWLAGEPPRLLAGSGPETADAGKPSPSTGSVAHATQAQGHGALDSQTSTLPSAWQTLQRVEARKYPEADAVILRRLVSYTLGSSPSITSERDEFIQVLTPEGKRFGDIDIEYSPPFEDLSFLDCEVLRPDGKLERLDPDAIREGRESALGDYQAGHRKFFSLPGVAPGAVLRVRYRTQWKQFPMPHISLEIPLGGESPAIETSIEVSVPKESSFHYELERLSAPDPKVKQTSYGTTYAWRLNNLPPRAREVLAAPHNQPRLMLSTFPDWPAFAGWYLRISKLADAVTPELSAKAAELTREVEGDRAKVLAIYNFVAGLRYVAVPMGINSFRPHAAASVLQNQFGDCKDKANLFNTLLRCLNIDACLVLVPRFGQARDSLPGLAFNHAISKVNLAGQTLWVDTTDDVCRFGLLPPGDPGRRVLVLDGQTSVLSQLPVPEPGDHQLKLHAQVDCSSAAGGRGAESAESAGDGPLGLSPADNRDLLRTGATARPQSIRAPGPGGPWPITLSVIATGFSDYELRTTAREALARRASLPLLAARFRPVAGSFALQKQSATSVSKLDENFSWQADGSGIGIASTAGGGLMLRCPFWVPKEWDQALHLRESALFLNQGYPLTLEEEVEFTLPAGMQPTGLPAAHETKAQPLRWSIEWKKAGQNKLSASFRAELVRGELSLGETPVCQQQLGELLTALAQGVLLSK